MDKENSNHSNYLLGETPEETRRLIRQARLYDGATRRLLREAGIGAGMKVLDVGTGAGDVAFLASELVGPAGRVVGVDRTASTLETARARARATDHTNVEFREGDVRTLSLEDDFDAAVGRLVLLHVPDPVETLRNVVGHVRPGGCVAFEECDITLPLAYAHSFVAAEAARLAERVYQLVDAGFRRSGVHVSMAFGLYQAFRAIGLEDPHFSIFAPYGGNTDWEGYDWLAEGLQSMLPALERFGIATAEDVDVATLSGRLRAEVVQTGVPLMLPPHVCGWATVPSVR